MAEAEIEINGGIVVYEFVGPDDGEVVVLTPGGRFSKDYGGVHELAYALADGGKRVLLWDRPNCGRSDIQLYGRSESHMRAETMGMLLKTLGIDQVVVGGRIRRGAGLDHLHAHVPRAGHASWPCGTSSAASTAAVAGRRVHHERAADGPVPGHRRRHEDGRPGGQLGRPDGRQPAERDRLRAIGAEEFERVMNRWMDAFVPKPNEPIPGVSDWEFEQISVPTLIVRGGVGDYDHPKRTSLEVYSLIKGSRLIEPPWPEDAWEQAARSTAAGTGALFDPWVDGGPGPARLHRGQGGRGGDLCGRVT